MQRPLVILSAFSCLFMSHVLSADERVGNLDRQHGHGQVVQMLSDRPEMAHFMTANGEKRNVSKEDAIWQWAAENYGHNINGSAVEWDKRPLPDKPIQYLSDHDIPMNGSNGRIRIRTVFKDNDGKTRKATFSELWSACVFELINMRNATNYMALYSRAIGGEFSRRAWIRENTEIEHKACLNLAAFYREVWVPWSRKTNIKPDIADWCLDVPHDYDKWIQKYDKSVETPYSFWGDYYDTMIKPYLEELKKQRRSAKTVHGAAEAAR